MGEFDHALILTSPHVKGQKVRDAQWLLSGHNDWSTTSKPIDTYAGKIDGDCGTETLTAAKQAKFWLGYAEGDITPTFGQVLYNLLEDQQKMSKAYLDRRVDRIHTAAQQTVGEKALQVAITQLGIKENPFGSNEQKYGVWYGFNGVPWCDIFISWCFAQIGVATYRYSYVPQTVHDARYGLNHLMLVTTPQVGDLMCYHTFEGPDMHIAFFDGKIDSRTFWDVGGNTGPINMSNGGEVLRQVRDYSQVSHIVRVR